MGAIFLVQLMSVLNASGGGLRKDPQDYVARVQSTIFVPCMRNTDARLACRPYSQRVAGVLRMTVYK